MAGAPTISASLSKKRIAIFLDGTWNAVGDNTNVWRLKSLLSAQGADRSPQLAYYDIGVNGFVGGMVGKGLSENVQDAYKWLIDQYESGDEVFIFGFSRGAFTARSLAGLIAKFGLLKPGSPLSVNQLYDRYRRATDRTLHTLIASREAGTLKDTNLEEQWMLKYSLPITVKVVAVWDTVGALGVPFGHWRGISRSTLGFLHTGLRLPIENAFQALAIDDHRRAFSPTLWTVRKPTDLAAVIAAPRPISSVEQRWFVGAHANVGGGCMNDLLAQIPLRWVMNKASLNGLAFRSDVEIDGDVMQAPISDSYKEFMHGAYSSFSSRYYRPIGAPPIVAGDGTHSNVNETIDASVFERYHTDRSYRPPSLTEWAKRQSIAIEEIRTSVLANAPRTPAPN